MLLGFLGGEGGGLFIYLFIFFLFLSVAFAVFPCFDNFTNKAIKPEKLNKIFN